MSRRAHARVATGTLLAAMLLASGCGEKKQAAPGAPGGAPRGPRKVPVTVTVVTPRAMTYSIDAVGQLAANQVIHVPARVPGIVEDVRFDVGTPVHPGMLLATIDPDRYRLAAEREEARVAEAEAAADEAAAAGRRRESLAQRNPEWVTDEERASFSAKAAQAQAALAAARAASDIAERDLADSRVRADATGVVERRLVDPGQQVAAGAPLATIVDTSRLRLVFRLAESEAARLGPSSRVTFRVSALDEELTATLAHVGAAADPSTRQVESLAWVDSPPPELKPGYFAQVRIDVGTAENALVVPQTAVLPTERGLVAYVVDEAGVAHERRVALGLQTPDGLVEVREGLSPGETVVVRGAAALREGAVVEIEQGAAS